MSDLNEFLTRREAAAAALAALYNRPHPTAEDYRAAEQSLAVPGLTLAPAFGTSSLADATVRVVNAYRVPGRSPEHHQVVKDRLAQDWPTLSHALRALVASYETDNL